MKKNWNISIEPNVLPGINVEPILGEFAWHSVTLDPTILDVSKSHFESILGELKSNGLLQDGLKILEVGAYAHITGYMLADEIGAKVTLADISQSTLTTGYRIAMQHGFNNVEVERVACDFHELPFESNKFDVVYIAAALHHTWRYQSVLSELARVTAKGGLLILENEPLRRELCFYEFRTNRPDNFDQIEIALAQYDLLRTIAEPYYGSRAEFLFGMTENQEMYLEKIINAISSDFKLENLCLNSEICMGELDKGIDNKLLNAEVNCDQIIFDQVREGLVRAGLDQSIKQYLDKVKLSQAFEYQRLTSLMGRINRRFELSRYSSGTISKDPNLGLIANNLRGVDFLKINRALLFGGSLRLVATKEVSSKQIIFPAVIPQDGAVATGFDSNLNKLINTANQLFPNVQESTREDLIKAFGSDWDISEGNEIVVATPNKPDPEIHISYDSCGSLLISARVYAVVDDSPWSLGLYVDDELRAYIEFSKSDSGLLVASISNPTSPNVIRFSSLAGAKRVVFNIPTISIINIEEI
jgi:ubiquinone/menaquinone biosynthesis C-methylase UbiE